MPRYRALIIGEAVTGLARDNVVNSAYFEDHGDTTDADGLAQDLATALAPNTYFWMGCNKIRVKLYDMAEPEPRDIQGEAVATRAAPGTSGPREIAVCLSFFAANNRPRNRGRLYLGPVTFQQIGERPNTSVRDQAIAVGTILRNLGGVDVDWSVYSPTIHQLSGVEAAFQPVSTMWVDDEWDTVRSRGYRATTRTQAVINE
jgi:hypothetical protein